MRGFAPYANAYSSWVFNTRSSPQALSAIRCKTFFRSKYLSHLCNFDQNLVLNSKSSMLCFQRTGLIFRTDLCAGFYPLYGGFRFCILVIKKYSTQLSVIL